MTKLMKILSGIVAVAVVVAIFYINSGVEDASVLQLPTENEQIELVSRTMNVFAVSVNEKSMQKFYDHISSLWKKQLSVKKLDEAYGKLFGAGVDLTVLSQGSPRFSSEAVIDENGVLVLIGHYPTRPTRVSFKQRYIYDGLGWRLLGFSINFR